MALGNLLGAGADRLMATMGRRLFALFFIRTYLTGVNWGRGAAWLALGVTLSTGCAAWAPVDERDLPTLRLQTERLRPDPVQASCKTSAEILLLRGPVPSYASSVARLRLVAVDRPAPLSTYESVLREWSVKHCVDGVSVLQIEEATGRHRHVLSVVASVWTQSSVVPAPVPSKEVMPDAGTAEQEFWD